ncbi:MAG: hypothetical protein OXC84_10445 [Gammaproteobacteria bacterium]|nr:hypothetical protein [Gammaproteobacteria bacterium]
MAIDQWFTCAGLVLDIGGVCLLFWFGLSSRLTPTLDGVLTWRRPQQSNESPRTILMVKILAHLGLFLLVLGFLLQIAGSVLLN